MVSRMMNAIYLFIFLNVTFAIQAGEYLRFQAGEIKTSGPQFKAQVSSLPDHLKMTQLRVVQFKQAIGNAEQNLLSQYHLKPLHYIPDDALIVWGLPENFQQLSLHSQVQTVLPMLHAWKMSETLPYPSVFTEKLRQNVLVQLADEKLKDNFLLHIQNSPEMELLSGDSDAYYIRLSVPQIKTLAQWDEVLWVQPMELMRTQVMDLFVKSTLGAGDYSDLTGYESGTKIMGFEEAWQRGLNGQSQIVAMSDTGIDTGDLNTLLLDVRGQVIKGYTLGLGASNWSDPMGHGTHVSGSVVSKGEISQGKIRGGAYGAQFIVEGIWSPLLENISVPSKLSTLFQPVYDDGARIHTNSWGGGQVHGSYDSFASQVDEFIWKHPDMLILFAAGNEGIDGNKDGRIDENSLASPGSAKNVVTVGASENLLLSGGIQKTLGELLGGEPWGVEPLKSDLLSNNPNGMAAFSSRGPCTDGRIKPDIVAPGTNIVSNCSTVPDASPLWGHYNPMYCYSGGTSMSTPLTAGAVAVLRQYINQEWKMPTPSAALMKAMLMQSADDMYPGQYGTGPTQEIPQPVPNNHEGYGRVNISRATSPLSSGYYYQLIDEKKGVGTGEVFTQKISVPAGHVKVMLAYSDAPAAPNAKKALVNNLDLIVEKADASAPVTYSATSTVNNVEQLIFDLAQQSELTLKVKGVSVPKGIQNKQAFAVVVSQ